MGKLSDAQAQFTWMIGQLIHFAFINGYRVRGLCWRCVKEGHHMKDSLHYDGLAVDFALDIRMPNGKWRYCDLTEDYRELGEFWETIGGAWGGRFTPPDGNHFSYAYGGRK
jgi:hypothetical protein